jgi:hypothetical protein
VAGAGRVRAVDCNGSDILFVHLSKNKISFKQSKF